MSFKELVIESSVVAETKISSDHRPLVAVAMSGGVDSSTVAALMAREYGVVGLTMQLWDQKRSINGDACATPVRGRCCSTNDVYDARRVAEHLDFPFYVVNHQRQFEETVVHPFVSEYLAGRTPIPCTHCNNHIKFGELLRLARQGGADYLATGHYARVELDRESGRYLLRKAVDETRDQSYFLFGLTQEQLSRSWFPLGEMRKLEVRELAREMALPVAEKPESHEICFVPDGDYARFLEKYQQERGTPVSDTGEVVTAEGEVLAKHDGLYHFTVGQRKGLGVAVGNPLYVISLNPASRRVVVGEGDALLTRTCFVRDTNWIAVEAPTDGLRVEAKIRHQHSPAPATLYIEGDGVRVEFDNPQRAVTPGQAAVFYQGDLVVGGGWIERVGT